MSRLQLACEQIKFARSYTLGLIEDVDDSDWFRIPEGGVSHVGWQVGHLAMAQYGLTLLRIRGKEREDKDFITNDFLRTFKKGSTPSGADNYPPPCEIRKVLADVHETSLAELAKSSDADLTDSVPEPYAVEPTKLGSILFCSVHEFIHAGQIGMIRRLLGKDPIR